MNFGTRFSGPLRLLWFLCKQSSTSHGLIFRIIRTIQYLEQHLIQYEKSVIIDLVKMKDRNIERLQAIQQPILIKIHIGQRSTADIILKRSSNIEAIIYQCITKYKLKKEAYEFLKKQIEYRLNEKNQLNNTDRMKKNTKGEGKSLNENNDGSNFNAQKKMLKQIRYGDIDKNRISIQRTPKLTETTKNLFGRQTTSRNKKSHPEDRKSSKRKIGSQKENINDQLQVKSNKKKVCSQSELLPQINKQKQLFAQQSIIIKSQQQSDQDKIWYLEQSIFSNKKKQFQKINSTTSLSSEMLAKMKQFSLKDLENEMNQQIIDIKFEKKVKLVEPELCRIFGSIIKYNPANLKRIDPRYACFEELSEPLKEGFHKFLLKLNDNELNSLDFDGFKRLIVKHRANYILDYLY